MSKRKSSTTQARQQYTQSSLSNNGKDRLYCAVPDVQPRIMPTNISPERAGLIIVNSNKWVNGTVLHYYFYDNEYTDRTNIAPLGSDPIWRPWTANEAEKSIVRQAFEEWKGLPIGLEFREVFSREEAEIRIGFMQGDGSWSYVGRQIIDLQLGVDERTMNFGWSLTQSRDGLDTALHEIGHTLGFPHEHQNPNAGIIWDEDAVYAWLAGPPNMWSRDKTFHNVLRKLPVDSVRGSDWDPDSIMEYPFPAGVIKEPPKYRAGVQPHGGLSKLDVKYAKFFYPTLSPDDHMRLIAFQSIVLDVLPGKQKNFVIEPDATRYYHIQTFGMSDSVLVLFEDQNGDLRYYTGDDDSGEDRNASLHVKLFKGHRYILRMRLYYHGQHGQTSIMMW